MSAYHFKYFQNIQFKNHGIAPTPPDLPTLKAYPTPGVGGRFGIFSLKWRERMNLKVPGATLPLGCAILSTRARTVRGVGTTPLRRTRVNGPWICRPTYSFKGKTENKKKKKTKKKKMGLKWVANWVCLWFCYRVVRHGPTAIVEINFQPHIRTVGPIPFFFEYIPLV